jgi:hypothetical protein
VTSKIFGAVLLIAGGSLAMLGAIRRASSRVRSLAAARPLLEIDVGERLPPGLADDTADPALDQAPRRTRVLTLDNLAGGAASLASRDRPLSRHKKLASQIPDFFRTFVRNPLEH